MNGIDIKRAGGEPVERLHLDIRCLSSCDKDGASKSRAHSAAIRSTAGFATTRSGVDGRPASLAGGSN